MTLFKFPQAIPTGEPISILNHGNHKRDFAYIDGIVEGGGRVSVAPAAPYRLFNIGNSDPVKLADYITAPEQAWGRKAIRNLLPLQPGDVPDTFADTTELTKAKGYATTTSVKDGGGQFEDQYQRHYGLAAPAEETA